MTFLSYEVLMLICILIIFGIVSLFIFVERYGLTEGKRLILCDECHDYCERTQGIYQSKCNDKYNGLKQACEKNLEPFDLEQCHEECWNSWNCREFKELGE